MSASVVRAMTSGDLPGVASVTNAAFGALGVPAGGAGPAGRRAIPALFFAVRCADPRGRFVAVREQDPGRVAGALISVARGTLGWFGPLAVHPHAQRSGAGGKLVAACTTSWRRRGVRLMGLETLLLAIWSGRLGHLAVHAAQHREPDVRELLAFPGRRRARRPPRDRQAHRARAAPPSAR